MAALQHRLMGLFVAVFLVLIVLIVLSGCNGGGLRATPGQSAAAAPEFGGLPPIPTGAQDVRQAQMIDNDSVDGAGFSSGERAVIDGTTAQLAGGSGPGWQAAWAMYTIPARPAAPTMITVTARYLDAVPQNLLPGEGYWVAVADYSASKWVWSGIYTQLTARIAIPASMDAVSPGNNIYVVVAVDRALNARVDRVQAGYDTGVGYEDYTLAAPGGEVVGISPDIQVSPAGDPRIAYLRSSSIFDDDEGQMRVAYWSGAAWVREDVPTAYTVRGLRFALGDGNRRALLGQDSASGDLHLLTDDGSGTFATDTILEPAMTENFLGSVVFINGADNPAGPLDTVLCSYITPDVMPNYKARYYRLTFGMPAASGDILPAGIIPPERMMLTRSPQKTALVAIPYSPLMPNWDITFGEYSAVADAWNFGLAPVWAGVDLNNDDSEPSCYVQRLPGGALAAGFVMDGASSVLFGLDSAAWAYDPVNRIPAAVGQYLFDVESYSDGRLGFIAAYGSLSPVLLSGTPGSPAPWQRRYLNDTAWSAKEASLAIGPDDTAYVAAQEATRGSLRYYRITPSQITSSEIDKGAGGESISVGYSPLVYHDGRLYVFYNDLAHMRVMRAVNENGVWLEEGHVLTDDIGTYYIMAAGYLENRGLMYVAYVSIIDYAHWIAVGEPESDDWDTYKLAGFPQQLLQLADDGTDVAALPLAFVGGSEALGFSLGDPRTGPHAPEVVTSEEDLVAGPYSLEYNPANGHWGLLTRDDNANFIYYFERTGPGTWLGPYSVADEPGPTADIGVVRLTYTTAGLPRAVLMEKADASTVWNINVYAGNDVPTFSYLATVASVDTALEALGGVSAIPDDNGEPIISIAHGVLPLVTLDMSLFTPLGGGVWGLADTWHSPLHELFFDDSGPNLCQTPLGVAQAAIEADGDWPTIGRLAVHYPW